MALGTETQQQLNRLFRLLSKSLMIHELVRLVRATSADYAVGVNISGEDAKKMQIEDLRGYLGTYIPNTNTATLSDNSTISLSDSGNLAGEWVNVVSGGTVDLGSGAITLLAGDRLRHDGIKWYKEGSTTSASGNPLIIGWDEYQIKKADGNSASTLQTGDLVYKKVVSDGATTLIIDGHTYLSGSPDPDQLSSYNPTGTEIVIS